MKLRCENLVKKYGVRTVVKGVSMEVNQGEIVGFRIEKVIREGRKGQGRFVQILVADNAQTPRPGSKIWRNYDCDFERSLEKNMPSRVLSVTLSLSFTDDSLNVQAQREDGLCVEKDFDLSGLPLAQNQARMKEMIVTQLSKKSDNLEFTIEDLAFDVDGGLPLMSAAFLNSIRRDLATEFAGIPVKAKIAGIPSKRTENTSETAGLTHPQREGELMRSKYCIRAELGICLKNHHGTNNPKRTCPENASQLFLKNNGNTFPLHFDCSNCEMIIFFSHSKKN